jgi:GxxExxY protein
VIVELKAVPQLAERHEAQLLNYLRATEFEVGLLLNFGPKPTHRRKVYDNEGKLITWKPNS